MKNNNDKQNNFVKKVLKILERMNDVTADKTGDRIALIKDKVQFGYIKDEEIYLITKAGSYDKFPKILEIRLRAVQDELLRAVTQSYWDACRERV